MAGTCANFGILLSTLVIARLVDSMGYSPVFIALSVLDLAAALVAWTVIRKPVIHA